jgi:hypothetical protein
MIAGQATYQRRKAAAPVLGHTTSAKFHLPLPFLLLSSSLVGPDCGFAAAGFGITALGAICCLGGAVFLGTTFLDSTGLGATCCLGGALCFGATFLGSTERGMTAWDLGT